MRAGCIETENGWTPGDLPGLETDERPKRVVDTSYKRMCRRILNTFAEDAARLHWSRMELMARLALFKESPVGSIVFALAELEWK